MAKITFDKDKTFDEKDLDLTLLEMALKNDIPHLHSCGAVGRCSTCQVKVLDKAENLLPATRVEERFRQQWGMDEDVRLACQAKVKGPVKVARLIREDEFIDDINFKSHQSTGQEIQLAVLFSDIRDFTNYTGNHMAHDVIHLLNRYFHTLGDAIVRHNGYIHQYYGDGIMALFGFYARDPRKICLDATLAAMDMLETLESFNKYFSDNFGSEFKIGIGVHFGEVLAAKIGHPQQKQLTVMGDVVNMASRVESFTKTTDHPLVISDAVYQNLGPSVLKTNPIKTELKGITGAQKLFEVTGLAKGFKPPKKASPGIGRPVSV